MCGGFGSLFTPVKLHWGYLSISSIEIFSFCYISSTNIRIFANEGEVPPLICPKLFTPHLELSSPPKKLFFDKKWQKIWIYFGLEHIIIKPKPKLVVKHAE